MAHHGRRHHPRASGGKGDLVKIGELGFNLVVVVGEPALEGAVVVQGEGEQHGFFQPLVDDPAAIFGFRHSPLAAVQSRQGLVNGVFQRGIGVLRRDAAAVFKSLVDDVLNSAHGLSAPSSLMNSAMRCAASTHSAKGGVNGKLRGVRKTGPPPLC